MVRLRVSAQAAKTPRSVNAFVSVDPGVDGSGWALWPFGQNKPCDSGSVEPEGGRCEAWSWRCASLVTALASAVRSAVRNNPGAEPAYIFLEEPQFFEGRGLAAARHGSLVKLSLVAGMTADRLSTAWNAVVQWVPVRQWKGNLPKAIVECRVRARLPGWKPATGKTHEVDAVGIGLFVRGLL